MGFFLDHSLLLLLVAACLFTMLWLWSQRQRLALRWYWVIVLSVLHVLTGVGCVKVFAMLEAGSVSAGGAMSLFGAVFFLPLVYWIGAKLSKRRYGVVCDVFVVPMVFTLACARVNCLLSGCCFGSIIPGTALRWPTREAELLFYALILVWFFHRTRQKRRDGVLYPAYMAAYGAFRFVVEFMRFHPSGSLFALSHLWAAICFLTGLSLLPELSRRGTRSAAKTPGKSKSHPH